MDQIAAVEIVATHVSIEEYMEAYAGEHCEWVEGVVIRVSPTEIRHNLLSLYLYKLLDFYFDLNPIGKIFGPAVMVLPEVPNRRREPDLLVILEPKFANLKPSYLDGAADICIEIVSWESVERDRGAKFVEYEKGGVQEYWIIDPLHHECSFYRLNAEGIYQRQEVDADDYYRTPLLPQLAVHVPTLWQPELPRPSVTFEAVRKMLN
jgi:Uma2 family endonuclease